MAPAGEFAHLAAESVSQTDALVLPPSPGHAWTLVEEGLDLAREHEIESLFTISNGYLGVRGSLDEGSTLSAPGTFVAGVFEHQTADVPELVSLPDLTLVRILSAGEELRSEHPGLLEHRRILDLHRGILWRRWVHRDAAGRVLRIGSLRLTSLADRHVVLQVFFFTPVNFRGPLRLEFALPAYRTLELRTGVHVDCAVASRLVTPGSPSAAALPTPSAGTGPHVWELDVELGDTYRIERVVCVHTSRDAPTEAAPAHATRALRRGTARLAAEHAGAWAARWAEADIQLDGDPAAARALRFALYHLIGSANPDDERCSVGARALTGPAYQGHVFWDTEIYMLPFFLHTRPAAARALLGYRFHTLPAARQKAAEFGYRGALYSWESADSGAEVTPSQLVAPDGQIIQVWCGLEEHHISADVAYAVWRYWEATGDSAFLLDAGAEILLETARFWASRGRLEADGRYHIRGVIGPDEYHEHVDDNAYTNALAQWNLEHGVAVARLCAARWPNRWRELAADLALSEAELERWQTLAAAMYLGSDPASGLIEQFQGYHALEPIDLGAYAGHTGPMDLLLGRERTGRSQVIKQADVVLLLHLLEERFPPAVRAANYRYYEPRTSHGSSLSPGIHALVAARLGKLELAERYFTQTAEIDLANNMGNAAGGVHMAALGSLWQATVFGFAGLRGSPEGLTLDPHLPRRWRRLHLPFCWRGARLELEVSAPLGTIEVALSGDEPVRLHLAGGDAILLEPGQRRGVHQRHGRWGPWQEVTS